jgi:hypothetical protein
MNKRIIELAEQAGMYVDLNGNPWPKWMSAEECEVAYEKFAELIVEECAKLASQETSLPYDSYSEKIRKYFGVNYAR